MANLAARLKTEIQSRFNLTPTDVFLTSFLSTANPAHPLPVLASTAHFRLLTSDFTTTLTPTRLPTPNIQTKETTVTIDTPVQILDILDTSTSNGQQLEALDRVEKGEEIRGREVIRNVPVDGETAPTQRGSTGPHKLLLQDSAGTTVWAFEMERIEKVSIVNTNPPVKDERGNLVPSRVEGMQIGAKLLIRRGTKVRRGLVMLTPGNTTVLGGKVDVWDEKWREGRKARLQEMLDGSAG